MSSDQRTVQLQIVIPTLENKELEDLENNFPLASVVTLGAGRHIPSFYFFKKIEKNILVVFQFVFRFFSWEKTENAKKKKWLPRESNSIQNDVCFRHLGQKNAGEDALLQATVKFFKGGNTLFRTI